jgi:hypothetical protein
MDNVSLPPTKTITITNYQPSTYIQSTCESNTKSVSVDLSIKKDLNTKEARRVPKEKVKRVVTNTDKWTVLQTALDTEQQLELLDHLGNKTNPCAQYVYQQIHIKQSGYKAQDIQKGLYRPDEFIQFDEIVELMKTSKLICYYCLESSKLIYEHVREPKQWSLERIDNSHGHNTANVVIACLQCNLRRKTMCSDKYVATKQTVFVKVGDPGMK